jgi:hypothetical protein
MVTEKEKNSIVLFNDKKVRRVWFKEEWFFSVVDVVGILTDSENPRNYWKVLKSRLNDEGSQVVTNCNRLKMIASDDKMRETDCLSTKNVLRLVLKSFFFPKKKDFIIPRKKESSIKFFENFNYLLLLKNGYTKEWVNRRLKTIEVRKELTDEITNMWISNENHLYNDNIVEGLK